MPSFERHCTLREVGAVRKKDWYWSFVLSRRDAIAKSGEK